MISSNKEDLIRHPLTCRRCGHTYQIRLFPFRCHCGITYKHSRHRGVSKGKVGVGDVLADVFYVTGIKSLYLRIRGKKECGGCNRRRLAANRLGRLFFAPIWWMRSAFSYLIEHRPFK